MADHPPSKMYTPVSPYSANDLDFSQSVVVGVGLSESNAVNLGSKTLVGFRLGAFTGGGISFLASVDGVTWDIFCNSGAVVSLAVAGGTYNTVDPSVFAGVRHLKIVTNAPQDENCTFTLVTRPV